MTIVFERLSKYKEKNSRVYSGIATMPEARPACPTIEAWTGRAYNQEQDSPNEIHGDDLARGLRLQRATCAKRDSLHLFATSRRSRLGLDYLAQGRAHMRVLSPPYDGEAFQANILEQSDAACSAQLRRRDGTVSARADVAALAEEPPAAAR